MAYAINNGISWINSTKTKNVTGVPKKTKKTLEIVHSIFSDYADYCEDPFWKNILNDMSVGKFPRSINYKPPNLYFQMRSKTRSKMITVSKEPSDPVNGLDNLLKFIRCNALLVSEQDKVREQEDKQNKFVDAIPILTEEIAFKNKKILQQLLIEYVIKTYEQNIRTKVLDKISLALCLNIITYNDITFSRDEDNRLIITDVSVVKVDGNDIRLTRESNIIPLKIPDQTSKVKTSNINKLWETFIKQYMKKKTKETQ